jgi:DivIVA domain-containing protein
VFGIGLGIVYAAITSVVVQSVPATQTGVASGMNANLRTVGSAIGAAVMLKIGTSLGPPDPATLAAHTVKRTTVPGELTVDGTSHLGIKSPYLVWPTASLLVLAVVFIILPVPPFPRDRHATSPIGPGYAGMPPTYGDPRAPAGMPTDVGRHRATPSDGRARLVDEIRSVRFTPVRIRRGYDMGSVDRLLDDAAQALGRGEPLAPILEAPQLATVSWREAYDTSEVDTFLETLRNSANRMDTHR